MNTIDHVAHLVCIYEKDLPMTNTEFAVCPISGEEPETGGNLRAIEKVWRQCNHAVHQVSLDNLLTDFSLARLIRRHRSIGQDEPGGACGREVIDDVLYPGKVGIADRGTAIFPANVLFKTFTAPVAHIERRVCEYEVGFQIFVQIIVKGVGVVRPKIGFNSSDGEVHLGQLPFGVIGFLAINRDVSNAAPVLPNEFFALHEHSGGATTGVIHAALVRLDHLNEQFDDAARGIEFATLFSFRASELLQEVFIRASKDVL